MVERQLKGILQSYDHVRKCQKVVAMTQQKLVTAAVEKSTPGSQGDGARRLRRPPNMNAEVLQFESYSLGTHFGPSWC